MEGLKIVGYCSLVAVCYGLAHDMVTANVCPDYFLPPYHPLIVDTRSPWLLALLWGVIATWWMGAILGVLFALTSRVGSWPRLSLAMVSRRIGITMASIWVLAMVLLTSLYLITNMIMPGNPKVTDLNRRLVIVGTVHAFSYSASTVAGLGLAVSILLHRSKLRVVSTNLS